MKPLVIWDGAFGRAVARAIVRETDAVDSVAVDTGAERIAQASAVALVSWRWCDATAQRLAASARAAGRRIFFAQLDGRVIVLGPSLDSEGPCYQCFRGRYLTHAVDVSRRKALWELFARDRDAGVPGFTPAMVRIVAAATLAAFENVAADPTVRCIDVLTGDVTVGELAAIHGCPGPHPAPEPGGERFVTALESLLGKEIRA